MEIVIEGKVGLEANTFWLVVACCISHAIRLKDSLISNEFGKKQLMSLIFCIELIIMGS